MSPSELVASIVNLAAASDSAAVLVAKSNCGIPQYVDGAIRFNGTPELMAVYAGLALDAGARIIGGCCGTTPEHLRRMRAALEAHVPGPKPDLAAIEARLGAISTGAQAQLRGELDRLAGAAAGAAGRRTAGRRALARVTKPDSNETRVRLTRIRFADRRRGRAARERGRLAPRTSGAADGENFVEGQRAIRRVRVQGWWRPRIRPSDWR